MFTEWGEKVHEVFHPGCTELSKYRYISTREILRTRVDMLNFSDLKFFTVETMRWQYQKSRETKKLGNLRKMPLNTSRTLSLGNP